ncbi:MAG: ATP-dependent sacrificial sulfur transferase LarE [Syntrophales bacterium]|nr:ATP-dependent sacrificial sulfur transferase LarE [Syntrophales bacterium]
MEPVLEKFAKLKQWLSDLGEVAIAFSGGVDSFFLLTASKESALSRVVAVTMVTPFFPKRERMETVKLTKMLDVEHVILEKKSFMDSVILKNPENRCYLCKKELFGELKDFVRRDLGIEHVAEGTNYDDIYGERPGMKAIRELGILSPLLELKFQKEEIRRVLFLLGMPNYEKQPYSCLATRIPYGEQITSELLTRIEKAEDYLFGKGFSQVRVRIHGDLARIEVSPEERAIFFDVVFMDEVSRYLKGLGFKHVALDLEGYGRK